MRTFRTTIVVDHEIDDDRIDEDTFHDMLRDIMEDGRLEGADDDENAELGFRLESVRDITVTELTD